MKYHIIGDEDAVLGFGMVGVEGNVAENQDDARAVFEAVLKDQEVGIVIITETVAELIRPLVDQYMFTKQFPLIVEIPDRKGPMPDKPSIRELVNQAIGIRL